MTSESLYKTRQAPPRTETTAIVALVCAVASFFVFPLAIVALVLVPDARRKIATSGGALEGESLCRTAAIISCVVLGLAGLALVIFVVFTVIFANAFNNATIHVVVPAGTARLLSGGGR